MATISFISTFDLSLSPPQFKFADTSDYSGQSITTSDVNGCFKVISPSGLTIYDNTDFSDANCDIKVSTSLLNQITIYLPLDTLSLVELGTYTIIYSVYDKNLTTTSTQTNSYDNEYVSPVVKITQDVNCISQIFGQADVTNYVVNGVSPTTLSRTNTLFYPPGVRGGAPSPVVVTSDTLRTTTFFNGTQTSEIETDLTYEFTDGLTVIDSVFEAKEIKVDCSYYCSIACGIEAFYNKKEREKRNPVVYQQMSNTFKDVMSLVALVRLLIECAGGTGISGYLEEIKCLIGDCNCGCNGSNDDPYSRVTGWGSLIGADGTNGTNGVDGSTWYSGTVAPSSGTGITGDWYINITTGDVYTKTSTTIWTLKLNIKGNTGAVVLSNVTTGSATTSGTTDTTLLSYTVNAGKCDTNEDELLITSWVEKSVITDDFYLTLVINSVVFGTYLLPNGTKCARLRATITRESATTYFFESIMTSFDATSGGYFTWGASGNSYSSGSLTFANTIPIDIKMQRASGSGTATSKQLSVIFLNK